MSDKLFSRLIAFALAAFTCAMPAARAQEKGNHADAARPQAAGRVTYKTVKIDGLDIFYREAGSPANPTVLLLHGFPTSSQMFRNLMPQLSARYHVSSRRRGPSPTSAI